MDAQGNARGWARTMTSLGVAYRRRACGERARNLDTAIKCFRLALRVLPPDTTPVERAGVMLNLANAYLDCGAR